MLTLNHYEQFKAYWEDRLGNGSAELLAEGIRENLSGPAPHALCLEAGELLVSAWVGDTLDPKLVPALWASARRVVAGGGEPDDELEAKCWNALHADPKAPEVSDESEEVEPGPDTPKVKLVRIDLVCYGTLAQNDLPPFMKQYIATSEGSIPILHPFVRDLSKSGPCLLNLRVQDRLANGYKTASGHHLDVALVRFGDLRPLLQRGIEIFEQNVRGFLGQHGVTNKRLSDTFAAIADGRDAESLELFPLLNNGITLSDSGGGAKNVDGSYRLVDPKVLNGQQTLRCWLYAREAPGRESCDRLDDLQVVVRILNLSVADDMKRIAFANNRQNAVSAADLRSIEASMKDIEKAFERAFGLSNPVVRFQRKRDGSGKRGYVDARQIYRLWCELTGDEIPEEEFFDSDSNFNELFPGLAEELMRNPQAACRRLLGLICISQVRVGRAKRAAIANFLTRLGVNANAVGVEDGGAKSMERRLLVYALWPRIRQGLLVLCLRDAFWKGAERFIPNNTTREKGTELWRASDDLVALLSGITLPRDLITRLWQHYEDWKMHSLDGEQGIEDDDVRVETFVAKNIGPDVILPLLGTEPASLIRDLAIH